MTALGYPVAEVETAAVLKKAISASRALAELKGMAERMPNQAKEVLRYRQALNHGFRQIKSRPLATGLFIEVAQLIKQTEFSVRRAPGTRIAGSRAR